MPMWLSYGMDETRLVMFALRFGENVSDEISTDELAAASQALDMMLDGIKSVRESGKIPTVEQITVSALHAVERKTKDVEAQKRFLSVLLAVCIARLVQS